MDKRKTAKNLIFLHYFLHALAAFNRENISLKLFSFSRELRKPEQ